MVVVLGAAFTVRDDALDALAVSVAVPENSAIYLWMPGPGTNLNVAVPAVVSWPIPRRWVSVQWAASASQNLTCPIWIGTVPALTVAVRETAVPEGTKITAVALAVMARVVEVAAAAARPREGPRARKTMESKNAPSVGRG
jgi:hypothetical protein